MPNDLSISQIPVLNSQAQYQKWSLEVTATAMIGGFNAPLIGTNVLETTDADQLDKLRQREEKATGLILKTVSQVLRKELMELRFPTSTTKPDLIPANAEQMWNHLKKKFEKKKGLMPLLDYKRLHRTDLVDDGTMEAQINKLTELRSMCMLNKFTTEDWQFASILLNALPDRYHIIPDTMLAAHEVEDLSIDDVKAKIIDQEGRYHSTSSSTSNYHFSSGNPKPTSTKKKARANDKCNYCQKLGHWEKECRKKKRDAKEKSNNATGAGSQDGNKEKANSRLNVVESDESDAPFSAYLGCTENWLLDSGATEHMTPFGSDFCEYATFVDSSKSVILGDGSTKLVVLGKGRIQRYVEVSPHKYRLMTLDDVLHVKGITRRFLSLVRFDDKGFNYRKEDGRLLFSKGNIQFPSVRLGNAFWIQLYAEKPPGAHALHSIKSISIKTLHERMGHLNWDALKRIRIDSIPPFSGVNLDSSEPPCGTCAGCVAGKGKRPTFKLKTSPRSSIPIERIHSDLTGPFDEALRGFRYACVFNCDCTRHVWVYFLRSKDQTLHTFTIFVKMVEKQTGRQVKFFRSDRGGEFMSKEFDKFLEERGIVRETSAPETPQQNGLAERMMRTLKGGSRAMLNHSGMSRGFWAEAMSVAAHVLNRSPRKGLGWRTPYELLYGHVPNVSYLRIFGCRAWAVNEKATGWDPKMKPMIFIGYEQGSKAYRLWDPEKRSVMISAKVRFDETVFPNRPTPAQPVASSSKDPSSKPPRPDQEFVQFPLLFDDEPYESRPKPAPIIPPLPPSPSTPASSRSSPSPPDPSDIPPSNTPPAPDPPAPGSLRRSTRRVKSVEWYGDKTSNLYAEVTVDDDESKVDPDLIYLSRVQLFATSTPNGEPSTRKEALDSPDKDKWLAAMNDELDSLKEMKTWRIAPRPTERKVVGCKWVFRHKMDGEGRIVRFKARLVAKGYSQQPGLDFTDTYAPVTRLESIRLLLGIAAQNDWEIRQIDVKTAYLYGDLDEEIFMEPPEGLRIPKGCVLLLQKAIYGLKQAGRQWFAKLKEVLTKFGMMQVVTDPNTYVARKVVNGKPCILVIPVYVDDLLPMGHKELTDNFESHIGRYFKVTILGDASHFLGIRLSRN